MVMVLRYQLHLDPNRNMSLLAAHPFIFCTHPRHCSGAYACRAVGERGCTSWTGQQPLTGQPETNQAGDSVNTRMDTPEAWGSNGTRLYIKSFFSVGNMSSQGTLQSQLSHIFQVRFILTD
ncbi:hypothetical protein ILYODFUR_033353 [Ilyodon furcidens]|uniref:Uncharacterized protein n=1 Tax=Ilyodon furcidens TaxID=33524 RepID=A0ABV0UQ35_9TELE